MATPYRGSTSRGAPGRACSSRSCAGCGRPSTAAGPAAISGTGSPPLATHDGAVTGVAGRGAGTEHVPRGVRSSREVVGDFALGRGGGDRRPPAASAAITSWSGRTGPRVGAPPRPHDLRCTGPRRRADAGRHRTRRRPGDQPGPDVALPRGHREPLAGVDRARHPDPVRAVPTVARRLRPTGCRRRCSPVSTRWARCGTSPRAGSTIPGSCWTAATLATEFALSGSEQNPDLTGKDVRQLLGRARGGPPGRCRRSSITASTSSCAPRLLSWRRG